MSTSTSGKQAAVAKERKQKKPHHIKRSDLDLPTYIEEQNSKKFSVLFQRFLDHTIYSTQFRIWVVLQIIAVSLGWGQLTLLVGMAWMMYVNTGKRKEGEMSAYSLFNEGVVGIAGSTDMEALEQELRTRGT